MITFLRNYARYIVALILMIILFVVGCECNRYKVLAENKSALQQFQTVKVDSTKNIAGIEVYHAPVAVTNSSDDIKKLSAKYFDLKKSDEKKIKSLEAFITANQKFIVHDTTAAYVAAEPDSSMQDTTPLLLLRKNFALTNEFYNLSGKVTAAGVHFDDIEFYNNISLRIGEQKRSWFRSSILTVQAINTNPHAVTTSINSITLKNRPNAWNRIYKPLAAAAIASFVTTKFIK